MEKTLNNLQTQDHSELFRTKTPDPFIYEKYREYLLTGQYPYVETVAKWIEGLLPEMNDVQKKNLRTHVYYSSSKNREDNVPLVHKSREEIKQHTGDYIRFEGNGIINGLKTPKDKMSCYLIQGVQDDGAIILKKYRGRKTLILPSYNQNQSFEIVPTNEFLNLPTNGYEGKETVTISLG